MPDDNGFDQAVKERFAKLPRVVQQAIVSADVSKHLQDLAVDQKLHIDQWERLENEVQYTLLGIQAPEDLPKNLMKEVGVDEKTAAALAESISKIVFEPIRKELERQLESPTAAPKEVSAVEAARTQVLAKEAVPIVAEPKPAPSPIQPATPPAPPPTAKVERAPLTGNYVAKQASHERKTIEGDPYRESVL